MPLPQQLVPTSHVTDERIAALYAGLSARVASELRKDFPHCSQENWPAPGSEDTELGVLMEPEVRHGAAEVYAGVQA